MIKQVSTELPYISALLPARNGERYLRRLIPRVLAMLSELDELLVINDGSTDNSSLILAELAITDTRLKILTTEGIGLVAALNLGIHNAKNSWIARFDVDDEYPLDRLHLQRQLIEENVAAIFSDYSFMTSSGISIGTVPSALKSNPIKLSLASSQRTPHPAVLINRAIVLAVGGYRVEDFPAEDLGLWFRMMKMGEFLSVPKVLLNYRLSGGSISSSNRAKQIAMKNQMISGFGSWHLLLENCIQEFTSTTSHYLEHPASTARIILHLKDIVYIKKLSGFKVSTYKLLVTLPFFTLIKIPFVLTDVLVKTLVRRLYRLVKNFF